MCCKSRAQQQSNERCRDMRLHQSEGVVCAALRTQLGGSGLGRSSPDRRVWLMARVRALRRRAVACRSRSCGYRMRAQRGGLRAAVATAGPPGSFKLLGAHATAACARADHLPDLRVREQAATMFAAKPRRRSLPTEVRACAGHQPVRCALTRSRLRAHAGRRTDARRPARFGTPRSARGGRAARSPRSAAALCGRVR